MRDDYWLNYWKSGPLNSKSNHHAKVGRTIDGVPISEEDWKISMEFIFNNIQDLHGKDVVDICAGSGALSVSLSEMCKSVIAIDISENLLACIPRRDNISTEIQDVRDLKLTESSIDIAFCYFSLQHFSEKEVISIFRVVFKALRPGGKFYIGDIPDINKRFSFFNNEERRKIFFNSIEEDKPIIGTWFHPESLTFLAEHTGFSEVKLIEQPKNLIFHHYRFDLLMFK